MRAAQEPMARLLQVADLYANGALLASSEHAPLRPLTRPECRHATGNDDPPRPDSVPLRGEIFGLTAMLARLSAKDEAKLMEPQYPRRSVKVMLVRDPSLSAFDPIEAALESLADLVVRKALPAPPDLAGFDALVIVARATSAAGYTASQIVEAIGPAKLPPAAVLWLTGRIDADIFNNPGCPVPVSWPVPLSHIAGFIASA
jgi:hypothetical protein